MSDPQSQAPGETPQEVRRIHVVGAALLRRGRVLAARRAPHVSAAGKWEFPGGKIEPGESPRQALRRELREEMDLQLRPDAIGEHLGQGLDLHPRLEIVLDVYLVELDTVGPGTSGDDWKPTLNDHDRVRWLDAETLHDVDWARADRPVLPKLRRLLTA